MMKVADICRSFDFCRKFSRNFFLCTHAISSSFWFLQMEIVRAFACNGENAFGKKSQTMAKILYMPPEIESKIRYFATVCVTKMQPLLPFAKKKETINASKKWPLFVTLLYMDQFVKFGDTQKNRASRSCNTWKIRSGDRDTVFENYEKSIIFASVASIGERSELT